jgi:hypothetical protein
MVSVPGCRELEALRELGARCDAVFGSGRHDIAGTFEASTLYLLQRRPVTGLPATVGGRG